MTLTGPKPRASPLELAVAPPPDKWDDWRARSRRLTVYRPASSARPRPRLRQRGGRDRGARERVREGRRSLAHGRGRARDAVHLPRGREVRRRRGPRCLRPHRAPAPRPRRGRAAGHDPGTPRARRGAARQGRAQEGRRALRGPLPRPRRAPETKGRRLRDGTEPAQSRRILSISRQETKERTARACSGAASAWASSRARAWASRPCSGR